MSSNNQMTGAEAVIKALVENDVEVIFGYPGGAVLPLYDAIFDNKKIRVFICCLDTGCLQLLSISNNGKRTKFLLCILGCGVSIF